MPLRDHFHPPLSQRRHWHAFHNAWATYLAADLNERLPPGWFAESNVQFGIEIDVATFEESSSLETWSPPTDGGWTPPAPALTIPFPLVTDLVEVLVYDSEAGPTLAGAIELVSPANKDRSEHREAFVSKCEAYLTQGVGLVVVDVVTSRKANLHDALLSRFGTSGENELAADLYATAYRPVGPSDAAKLEIWQEALSLGRPLPTMPLWLRGAGPVQVDLDAAYERTCREHRVLEAG